MWLSLTMVQEEPILVNFSTVQTLEAVEGEQAVVLTCGFMRGALEETGMDLQTVITRLESADAPSRGLDALIAEVIGWKRREEIATDPKTGEKRIRTLWLVPAGDDFGRVPLYTSNLQDAFDLAHATCPNHDGGCSWVGGKGTAVIEDGKYAQAATPAMALCVAALRCLEADVDNN